MSDQATQPSVASLLLAELDDATRRLILPHLQAESWPAEHVLFEEGTPGDTLYIIQTGLVVVSKQAEHGTRQVLRELGPGEVFGEMALLEEQPRSARVTTVTPTRLLAITRPRFHTLIRQHPAVAIAFLKAISAQLRLRYQEQSVLLEEKQALVEALATQNTALERALVDLRAAMATVAEHERVKRDLEIARTIQQQMLPTTFPHTPGLSLHATAVPATWVGGDFYDAVVLDSEHVALLLGDVSGKGIPAAMHMARFMGEFRACVRHDATPERVIQVLNTLLCQRNQRFSVFITVQYLVLDIQQRRLQFLCAGHPPILLRHAHGAIESLGRVSNIPLGIDDTFAYRQEVRQLVPGDSLLLYSDGTYERRDPEGRQLGLPRFTDLFAAAPAAPAAAIQMLQRALDVFSPQADAHDDTTLLCARVSRSQA